MDDNDMEANIDMLATRRSRRSTAGNRMADVMAEVSQEDSLDDDIEFVNAADEQDVFESDFESTDEEAENQAERQGDAEVVQEERHIKKMARSRLEKATAAAHAKHRVTFNPEIQVSAPVHKQLIKLKQHTHTSDSRQAKRQSKTRTSKRMHTVLNTSATVTRLKASDKKKATQARKVKAELRIYTQAELIAMALDTEEGNIREHKDYLKTEEEKRKRARVVRTTVEGPKLRWVSKIEEVNVVDPPPQGGMVTFPAAYRSIYGPPGTLFTPTTYTYASGSLVKTNLASTPPSVLQNQSISSNLPFSQYSPYLQSPFPVWPSSSQQQSYYHSSSATPTTTPAFVYQTVPEKLIAGSDPTTMSTTPVASTQLTPHIQQPSQLEALSTVLPEPESRIKPATKNYVVHELAQQRGTSKPSWAENMQAMFGNHVKWDEVKVYVGKNRPLARPRQICPITGRQAHYLDPRTGVPYSDSSAYRVLGQLLKHQYVWNPSMGLYLGYDEPTEPEGNHSAADGIEHMDSS